MATYTQSDSNATYTPTGTVDRQNQGIYITGTCTAPSQDNKSSKNAKFIVETASSPPPSSSGILNPPPVAYI